MAGTVTGLVVQKRNPKRVNVYVDGAYGFPLDLSVVMKWGLRSGQRLSDEEIGLLTAADDVEKAYHRESALLPPAERGRGAAQPAGQEDGP
jgi:regulatory protein